MSCEACRPRDRATHQPYTGRNVKDLRAAQAALTGDWCENCWGPFDDQR